MTVRPRAGWRLWTLWLVALIPFGLGLLADAEIYFGPGSRLFLFGITAAFVAILVALYVPLLPANNEISVDGETFRMRSWNETREVRLDRVRSVRLTTEKVATAFAPRLLFVLDESLVEFPLSAWRWTRGTGWSTRLLAELDRRGVGVSGQDRWWLGEKLELSRPGPAPVAAEDFN